MLQAPRFLPFMRRGACRRPLPVWSTTSFPMCRCGHEASPVYCSTQPWSASTIAGMAVEPTRSLNSTLAGRCRGVGAASPAASTALAANCARSGAAPLRQRMPVPAPDAPDPRDTEPASDATRQGPRFEGDRERHGDRRRTRDRHRRAAGPTQRAPRRGRRRVLSTTRWTTLHYRPTLRPGYHVRCRDDVWMRNDFPPCASSGPVRGLCRRTSIWGQLRWTSAACQIGGRLAIGA